MWIELLPYQEEALQKMKDGCILHGNVGSGKSLVSLMYYYTSQGGVYSPRFRTKIENAIDLCIITTPKKRDSMEWDEEMCAFGLSRFEEGNTWGNTVIVDSWNNIHKYEDTRNTFFIFDEQRLVGSGSWVNNFLKIVKNNPHWVLLSATPGDTWMDYVPVFIANGFYRNRTQFNQEHVIFKPFRNFPQVDRYVNVIKLERLRERILVDMIRPNERMIREEHCICDYDRMMYKDVLKFRVDPWSGEPITNASAMAFTLRKVVNSDPSRGGKLIEIVRKHKKVIVFYSYDYEREILLGLWYPEKVVVAEWNGHAHQDIPDSEEWVYLVQYTAGCEGWNCIKTDTIVFYSLQYSYKVFEQAKGRIDRLNSPFTQLNYYIFKSKAHIDLAILKAISTKKVFNARQYFDREIGWETTKNGDFGENRGKIDEMSFEDFRKI